MSTNIVKTQQGIEDATKDSLVKLVDYYSQFFSSKQVDALMYFWYGYDSDEVAKAIGIPNKEVVEEWLEQKNFREAVQAGYGKRQEVLAYGLEKIAIKAWKVLNEALNDDLDLHTKAGREQAKIARWVFEKTGADIKDKQQQDVTDIAHMSAETAKIIAEQLKENSNAKPPVSVKDMFEDERDNVVDGEVKELETYYNSVKDKNAHVKQNVVNVLLIDEEYKMQCHLCGKWYSSLEMHVTSGHEDVTLSFYRRHFGIPTAVPLSTGSDFYDIYISKT